MNTALGCCTRRVLVAGSIWPNRCSASSSHKGLEISSNIEREVKVYTSPFLFPFRETTRTPSCFLYAKRFQAGNGHRWSGHQWREGTGGDISTRTGSAGASTRRVRSCPACDQPVPAQLVLPLPVPNGLPERVSAFLLPTFSLASLPRLLAASQANPVHSSAGTCRSPGASNSHVSWSQRRYISSKATPRRAVSPM